MKDKKERKEKQEKVEKIEIVEEINESPKKKKGKDKSKDKALKMGFFKKLRISLFGFEQYPLIGLEKLRSTFGYLAKLMVIFALVISVAMGAKEAQNVQDNPEQVKAAYITMMQQYNVDVNEEQVNAIFSTGNTSVLIGSICLAMFIVMYVVFFLNTLLDAFATSIMGFFASRIIGIPLKYKALFNMSVSAVTLSLILTCVYLVANILTGFTINYFQAMYVIISFICLFAAILMMKLELIKSDKEKIEEKTKKIQKQSMEEENKVQ